MIENLKNKLQTFRDEQSRFNFLREYLQLLILKIIDEKGYFRHLAFVGGTALRILYDLKRFSEDLDFCLTNKKNFTPTKLKETLVTRLKQENLPVELTVKSTKAVAQINIKFPELLFVLGFTAHKNEKLFIKLEIDQNPPKGYQTQLTLVNNEFLISINHYDLPSLFASKLHALLFRKYTKGRDFYDLLWYLGHKIEPNYTLLNHAIIQTQQKNLHIDREQLVALLKNKIHQTDFKQITNDVAIFLEDSNEKRFLRKDFFLEIVSKQL